MFKKHDPAVSFLYALKISDSFNFKCMKQLSLMSKNLEAITTKQYMASNRSLTNLIFILVLACLCMGGPYISDAEVFQSTLYGGEVFGFSDQLVSYRERFTLGFFSPGGSAYSYLGIWFTHDANTIVWVANRNNPSSIRDGSLMLDNDGGKLKILNSRGTPLLTLNSSSNQAAQDSLYARLNDYGNFILWGYSYESYHREYIKWQSFDYPTDTLLPGMKLGTNFHTGQKWLLTSWIGPKNAASGTFTLEWNNITNSTGQLVMRRRGDIHWTSGILNTQNQSFENIPWLSSDTHNNDYNFSYVSNENESYFTYSVTSGRLSTGWVLGWEGILSDGDRPPLANGELCHTNTSIPGCAEQKRPGCRSSYAKFELQSGSFLGTSVEDNNWSLGLSDCLASCWNNCFCIGYEISSSIRGAGCKFWIRSNSSRFIPDKSGATSAIYVLNSTFYSPPPSPFPDKAGMKWWEWVIITGVVVTAILLLGFLFYLRRRKLKGEKERSEENVLLELTTSNRFNDPNEIGSDGKKGPDMKVFSFASIMAATNNFSEENKLGEGGFGPVYKGKLPEGQEIAVKRLSIGSGQGLIEFKNEIILIAKLQHVNLVRLWGCCVQGSEKMLIYEYMANKSLDFFLFDPTKRELLDWKKRYNIIEGIAQGLLYLHKYSRLRIIHRDLKASNILLDENMTPKISDFGTARIFQRNDNEANTIRVVGTRGYMAPEYIIDGIFSEKSDIYSFGVLILEIVSGRKINSSFYYDDNPVNLVGYAWELWKERNIMDLKDSTLDDASRRQISRCIHVGLLCVQESAVDRPTMSDVISILSSNETMSFPDPKEPAFTTRQREVVLNNGESASCCTSLSTAMEPR